MRQVVIENPVINSPFDEPSRHFKFTDEGITNQIIESRRTSSHFIPIARPKKKGKQEVVRCVKNQNLGMRQTRFAGWHQHVDAAQNPQF